MTRKAPFAFLLLRSVMALSICAFLAAQNTAQACMGPSMETQTFLTALPKDAQKRDMVAKVEVISTTVPDGSSRRHTVAKVIESIQGFEEGQQLTILSGQHSCARDYEVKIGKDYYISGRINSDGYFEGTWKGLALQKYWRKTID